MSVLLTMQSEQTPLLAPENGSPSSHLPTCLFPEQVVNECLADLRMYVKYTDLMRMLPVSRGEATMERSSVLVEAADATAPRSPGQIVVRPVTFMDTSPTSKIPPGAASNDADEYDVIESTRTRLLQCLAELETAS